MKRLMYCIAFAFSLAASAQDHPVRNANDNYVVTIMPGDENLIKNVHRIKRDDKGLYWFESTTALHSFDGINWKSHKFRTAQGRNIIVRINDMEITDDGKIWLATEGGIYIVRAGSEELISMKQLFPGIGEIPRVANCVFKSSNDFIFICVLKEGFYYYNSRAQKVKQIIIDSVAQTNVPVSISPVTTDKKGNFWGITAENKGIWLYNSTTGTLNRSWKNELFPAAAKRLQSGVTGITYGEKENVLWVCYGNRGILEKLFLSGAKSHFYSFTGDLFVRHDSNAVNRRKISPVKIDRDNNTWINIEGKYLVKLDPDIDRFEYLADDPELLPLGTYSWFLPENTLYDKSLHDNNNNILLWVGGDKQLAVIKKRNAIVSQVPWDTLAAHGVKTADYENRDGRKNIFFEKGRDDNYFLLQQDPGKPKLICLDRELKVKRVYLNDEWKKYPAYFSNDFNPDTFYVAILRPGLEPLDFRNVVIKDFRLDLRSFKSEEVKLDFRQRVQHYGSKDANGVSWLFSAGYLYSSDPQTGVLDSIYICEPDGKGHFTLEYVKGYDYPTALHKSSSTFWITFFPAKELYRINLKTRKIGKIIKTCFDRKECLIPSGVIDMYAFDPVSVYLQLPFSGMLINAFNDSVTYINDLYKGQLSSGRQNGTGVYKNWMIDVQPSEIHFLNMVSGQRKKLSVNEDFKGYLSQFNSRPLVNDQGQMIVMSSDKKEFILFNIDFPDPEKPGKVRFSDIKLNDKTLSLDSLGILPALSVKYKNYNSLYFRFSDYSIDDQHKISYAYALYTGGDTTWNRIEGEPELTFIKISPGNYRLLIRAENEYGGYSPEITALNISIIPPFTQTIWFVLVIIAAVALLLYGLYRYRLHQLSRLQKIRNNIATDLHDDIGSTLNSISIYSEVAKQQAGKEIPALDLIGLNSRKIVESMSDIVWTINPENDSFEKIIVRMRSFAHQLLKAKRIEYTFEADEQLDSIKLPMQVRKNFYMVFKEAVTNLVKYSGADRVSIDLKEEEGAILLRIRDNGKGILISPETLGNGLMNMKRRAAEIKAILNIESEKNMGTGVELKLKL